MRFCKNNGKNVVKIMIRCRTMNPTLNTTRFATRRDARDERDKAEGEGEVEEEQANAACTIS